MDSSFKPRPVLFQNPCSSCDSLLSSFNLDGKAITSHELSLSLCFISLCVLTHKRLIRDQYLHVIGADIKGNVLSSQIFFAKAEIWCKISFLIIFASCYFIYWSKANHYCFASGNKHFVPSLKIPAVVHLGQNCTRGSSFPLNPFLSQSCCFLTSLILVLWPWYFSDWCSNVLLLSGEGILESECF